MIYAIVFFSANGLIFRASLDLFSPRGLFLGRFQLILQSFSWDLTCLAFSKAVSLFATFSFISFSNISFSLPESSWKKIVSTFWVQWFQCISTHTENCVFFIYTIMAYLWFTYTEDCVQKCFNFSRLNQFQHAHCRTENMMLSVCLCAFFFVKCDFVRFCRPPEMFLCLVAGGVLRQCFGGLGNLVCGQV